MKGPVPESYKERGEATGGGHRSPFQVQWEPHCPLLLFLAQRLSHLLRQCVHLRRRPGSGSCSTRSLTEGTEFCRGDESRPRRQSTLVTGWQPITGPSPGVSHSEVRTQSRACAGSLNPKGLTCWACFSMALT